MTLAGAAFYTNRAMTSGLTQRGTAATEGGFETVVVRSANKTLVRGANNDYLPLMIEKTP